MYRVLGEAIRIYTTRMLLSLKCNVRLSRYDCHGEIGIWCCLAVKRGNHDEDIVWVVVSYLLGLDLTVVLNVEVLVGFQGVYLISGELGAVVHV